LKEQEQDIDEDGPLVEQQLQYMIFIVKVILISKIICLFFLCTPRMDCTFVLNQDLTVPKCCMLHEAKRKENSQPETTSTI